MNQEIKQIGDRLYTICKDISSQLERRADVTTEDILHAQGELIKSLYNAMEVLTDILSKKL